MSNTPLAGKTLRWRVEDVIVVLKACGADEARLRDESYLLEELRRIDAGVMDQWINDPRRSSGAGRASSCLRRRCPISVHRTTTRSAMPLRGAAIWQLADYVFAQAWKRSNYPKAVALARRHDLVAGTTYS